MNFVHHQPGLRVFYLGVVSPPAPAVLVSKNLGAFAKPKNKLVNVGLGWWSLVLGREDTDTLGPLAWWFDVPTALAQPQDAVTQLQHGHIDQQALTDAFADLSIGFTPDLGLAELLKRPLYQFLISLR